MSGEWTPELEAWMRAQAMEAGFDVAGVAPVVAATSDGERLDAERFAAWVEAGRAGEMEYLKRRDEQGVLSAQRGAGGDAVGPIGDRLRAELQRGRSPFD